MKIGILGGTFDPIHNGHMAIAGAAKAKLGLDEVCFVPAARTPLKDSHTILSVQLRLEMVRLAVAGCGYCKVSTVEIDRPGLSYTVDTIAELLMQLGNENELYFIIGLDSLNQFPRWREPARIIEMCRLVAVPRPGYLEPDKEKLEAAVPGIWKRLTVLDGPEIDISATDIRRMVRNGESITGLVPGPVAEYIKEHRLYLD